MESNVCPVCGNTNAKVKEYENSLQIDCINCGKFYIHEDFITDGKLDTIDKNCMYYYLIHDLANIKYLKSKNLYPYFIMDENDVEQNINKENYRFISLEKLYNIKPKNIIEQIERTILNLAEHCRNINGELIFHSAKCDDNNTEYRNLLKVIFFIEDDTEVETYGNEHIRIFSKINNIIDILIDQKYVWKNKIGNYKITFKGWEYINELQKTNKVANQAFVAMWFNPEMEFTRNVIKEAITECGYFPMIIDRKDHNNQIVPEIFYEIKRSLFVVADICGHRGGVYYEAGYAEALGKEVIITCSEDEHEEAHFDVKQKSAVIYKDEEDLKDRLIKRIIATVGVNK